MKESLVGHNTLIFAWGDIEIKLEYRPGVRFKNNTVTRTGTGAKDWKVHISPLGPWITFVRRLNDLDDPWVMGGWGDTAEFAIMLAKDCGTMLLLSLESLRLAVSLKSVLTEEEYKTLSCAYGREWYQKLERHYAGYYQA